MKASALLVLSLALLSGIEAHNWLKTPVTRNLNQPYAAAAGVPCDPLAATYRPTFVSSGGSLSTSWSVNHAGDHILTLVTAADEANLESGTATVLLTQSFTNTQPAATLTLPTLTVGTNYVLQYKWANYRNCVNLRVQAGVPEGFALSDVDVDGQTTTTGSVYVSANGMAFFDVATANLTCKPHWTPVTISSTQLGCYPTGWPRATTGLDGAALPTGQTRWYVTPDTYGRYDLVTGSVTCPAAYALTFDLWGCVPAGFELAASDLNGVTLTNNTDWYRNVDGHGLYSYSTGRLTCEPGFSRSGLKCVTADASKAEASVQTWLVFSPISAATATDNVTALAHTILTTIAIALDVNETQLAVPTTPETWWYNASTMTLTVTVEFLQPDNKNGFKAYSPQVIYDRLQTQINTPTSDLMNGFGSHAADIKLHTSYNISWADTLQTTTLSRAVVPGPAGSGFTAGTKNATAAAVMIPIVLLIVAALAYFGRDLISRTSVTLLAARSEGQIVWMLVAFSSVAALFLVVALAGPWAETAGWSFGLFRMCMGWGSDCQSLPDEGVAPAQAAAAFTVLAFFAAIAAIALSIATLMDKVTLTEGRKYVVGASLVAAGLAFAAMCLYAAYMKDTIDMIPGAPASSPLYGIGLAALTWLLLLPFAAALSGATGGHAEGPAKDSAPTITSADPAPQPVHQQQEYATPQGDYTPEGDVNPVVETQV